MRRMGGFAPGLWISFVFLSVLLVTAWAAQDSSSSTQKAEISGAASFQEQSGAVSGGEDSLSSSRREDSLSSSRGEDSLSSSRGEDSLSSSGKGDSLRFSVEEGVICLRVDKESRQPVEVGDRFPSDVGHLSCFTKIRGGEGTEVVHAWIHEGHTRARVRLKVGSDSWRTWSTKRILRSWTGRWEVKIMTPDGVVLKSVPFTVY